MARLGTAEVEIAGRNWLVSQLLVRGFEVATPEVDRGTDLIVFRELPRPGGGMRALPLQLKCATAESFSLDEKYADRGLVLAYVWNVLSEPCAHFMTFNEALGVLGPQAAASASWRERRYYAFNRISGDLRARLEPYRDRWGWLDEQLTAQPRSAVG